ncbi:DUF3634 family protein [Vibrio maerlii]|uniref:DUF3634 family protein n=1 Tax=Vibrio maerlii TaxID=2231648 RepID=UPI000E3C1172|nr:DUF3634 family protein [Vibrio maerlii]
MLYVILLAAVILVWLFAADRPVLKFTIKEGVITQSKGHFPPSFRHNCDEIFHKTPCDGHIKIYKGRTGATLKFSKSIPKKVQQRIRNVFPHQGFQKSGKRA